MAEKSVQLTQVGQEEQRPDRNLASAVGALADDRVLAEELRLLPFDGGGQGVYKCVLGYSTSVSGGQGTRPGRSPIVVPTGSANGSVLINPFRAVIGSRNLVNAAPSPNPTSDGNALANWRDVRSGIFVGGASSLTLTQSIAANASGNPRWDLIYATVAVDANQNTVTRRVKDPNTGSISTPSVPQYVLSPVTISVLQGTPAATPTTPTLPADSAGNYNVPLAYVRVPNGFGAGSTVVTTDIRATTLGNTGVPVSPFRELGTGTLKPASGNNDDAGTYAIRSAFRWNAAAGGRPGPFLPPDWVGFHQVIAEIDCSDPSSANWSHNEGDVVDDSFDWRNRVVIAFTQAGPSKFANDGTAAGIALVPSAYGGINWFPLHTTFGQTFVSDSYVNGTSVLVSPNGPVWQTQSGMNGGSEIDLYCDMSTGKLKVHIVGNPGARLFVWLLVAAQFPNK